MKRAYINNADMKPKAIFAGSPEAISRVYSAEAKRILCEKLDFLPLIYTEKEFSGGELPELKEVEFIFSTWGMLTLSENEIRRFLPSLKAVFYAAGTVRYFAKPFLNLGIKVFSAWAANAVPVAEYTVAQIILANKGFFKAAPYASRGEREKACAEFEKFKGNFGARVGIIGAGMIGKLVINMLRNYDIETLTFDPFLPDEAAEALGTEKVSLEKLFSQCNVVSNHLANNAQTVGMLNGALFEKMLPNAVLLNTGRGAQVNEADLINVLKRRPDITAILDVTSPEPPEADSEFYSLENCILTPHIAGSSGEEVKRMSEYMLKEFECFTGGKPTKYEVTKEMLKTMA